MDNNIFNNIEKEAKVNKEDIFKLASSVQNANLRDETVLRQLIHQVALMAGREGPEEEEEQNLKTNINNNIATKFGWLSKKV